jgi:hypothetical protein
MPKYLWPLAHVIIVSQGLTLFSDSLLHAVLKILCISIAVRLHYTLKKNLFVLGTCRFVFAFIRSYQFVEGLEYLYQPTVETFVLVYQQIVRNISHIIVVNVIKVGLYYKKSISNESEDMIVVDNKQKLSNTLKYRVSAVSLVIYFLSYVLYIVSLFGWDSKNIILT